MLKITISPAFGKSRLVSRLKRDEYRINEAQCADIVFIKREATPSCFVVLPMDYHIQNPAYIGYKIKETLASVNSNKLMVIVLAENQIEIGRVHEVQMCCLEFNANMMLCLGLEQFKALVYDFMK